MDLKTLLGDSYHDGMTTDEINTALSGMKIANLSDGKYVDKNKYEADIKAKDDALAKKAQELAAKMTADEKAAAEQAEKDALIESLKAQISQGKVESSKSVAESVMSQSKTILGIKDDDSTYANFISSIAGENVEATKALATYINKMINDGYEKGKKDATKDGLGAFSKDIKIDGGKDGKKDDNIGTKLAKMTVGNNANSDYYFKK